MGFFCTASNLIHRISIICCIYIHYIYIVVIRIYILYMHELLTIAFQGIIKVYISHCRQSRLQYTLLQSKLSCSLDFSIPCCSLDCTLHCLSLKQFFFSKSVCISPFIQLNKAFIERNKIPCTCRLCVALLSNNKFALLAMRYCCKCTSAI